jgi:hypothetical protein
MLAIYFVFALSREIWGDSDGSGGPANPVYSRLLEQGVTLDGNTVRLPTPTIPDGLSADAQRAALKPVAGSDAAVADLLRNSVTAPQMLKVRDQTGGGPTIVRLADLWFVVYADLDRLDPDASARKAQDAGPVEAANMRVETKLLTPEDLQAHGLTPPGGRDGQQEWYTHSTGRLLDRIHFEVTDRTVATRSAESVIIATATVEGLDKDEQLANRWWPITTRAGREQPGPTRPYAGGASYVKITRLASPQGALLVEGHFAFAEPRAWFDGAPILRSKIGLVAQDQIRKLRRELAEKKEP